MYLPYLLWAPYLSGKLTITWGNERVLAASHGCTSHSHLPVSPGVDGPLRSAVENVTGAHIPALIMLGGAEKGIIQNQSDLS